MTIEQDQKGDGLSWGGESAADKSREGLDVTAYFDHLMDLW